MKIMLRQKNKKILKNILTYIKICVNIMVSKGGKIMISDEELVTKMIMYRAEHNMTQIEFAKAVGITQSTLSSIETMKQSPANITKAKILLYIERNN